MLNNALSMLYILFMPQKFCKPLNSKFVDYMYYTAAAHKMIRVLIHISFITKINHNSVDISREVKNAVIHARVKKDFISMFVVIF